MSKQYKDTPRRRGTSGRRHAEYSRERIRNFIGQKVLDDITFYLSYKVLDGGYNDKNLPTMFDVIQRSQRFQDWKKKKLLEEFRDMEEFLHCNTEEEVVEIISAGIVASSKIEEKINDKIEDHLKIENENLNINRIDLEESTRIGNVISEEVLNEFSFTVSQENLLEDEVIEWYKTEFDKTIDRISSLHDVIMEDHSLDLTVEDEYDDSLEIFHKMEQKKKKFLEKRGLSILNTINRDMDADLHLEVDCESLLSEGKFSKFENKILCKFGKMSEVFADPPIISTTFGDIKLKDIERQKFSMNIDSHSKLCSIPDQVLEIMTLNDMDFRRRVETLANVQACTCLDYFRTGFKTKRLCYWVRILVRLMYGSHLKLSRYKEPLFERYYGY